MNQPLDMLRRFEACIEADRALPGDVAAWILDGLATYRKHGGRVSLCRCLGLRGPGKRLLDTLSSYEQRNAALRSAAQFVAERPVTPWERAERLAHAIVHHRGHRELARLSDGAERWRKERVARELQQAFKTGLSVPETPRGIYNLLQGKK